MAKNSRLVASAALLLIAAAVSADSTAAEIPPSKCRATLSEEHPDHVGSLPGWNQPLPSPWFSGYLHYVFEGVEVHTHYVFVEAEEVEGGDDGGGSDLRPLIYWSNGGPGASSMYGLLAELGPLILSDASLATDAYRKTGVPALQYNPHAWTRLGSVLLFDQPAPVGFSYCGDDRTSPSCGGIEWTDELAASNALAALHAFYAKFPCEAERDLYLAGESYAGIYIPMLARLILKEGEREGGEGASAIPLRGFAVGDGCLGTETEVCGTEESADLTKSDFWNVWFMAGHHQIPMADFGLLMEACHHQKDPEFLTSSPPSADDDNCRAALAKIKGEVGGFYEYSLYDDCTYRNGLFRTSKAAVDGALNDYSCGGGEVMDQYLKLDAVRDALHVEAEFLSVDGAGGGFSYTGTEPDLRDFYKEINGKLRVLVYNGDTDPSINSFVAEDWTSKLGFHETKHWAPWTVDGCRRMGGYVTRYEGGFDFLTIRGAGHMVPTYKPAAAFVFMQAWIKGEEYPAFDPGCSVPPAATYTGERETLEGSSSVTRNSMLRSS